MTIDQDRRAALLAAKLGALVRARWGDVGDGAVAGGFPEGATLVDGDRAWVLATADADRRLGAALAVAGRAGAAELHLLVDDEDPAAGAVAARRAACFATPPSVWRVSGTELAPVEPAAPADDPAPPPAAELYRPVLAEAGLAPVVEGGHLIGELRGLEVARVVVDDDGSARLEAGVGRFDREVASMMFAELGEVDSLARAVALVAEHRRPDAPRHPVNQLVPERWLRSVLIEHPELVGARELAPVGSAVPRANLREAGVASAVGVDGSGAPVVVTCSTGVDLEVVPGAADDRLAHDPEARSIVAVPARDALA
ncbi:MAG: hypothetical protein KDA97_00660, partial [Acidimicrobiales bacterium]|nr:hypothetical protein [Acidimicrobiales bacterium]